ncbi:hypothetical protein [Modestobacter sp. DSM 44400]|uniref:hypothetical protein n=1 Tax=Modestobacter sp. DSM 44400 TaxID=1550230 RepID=UPI001115409C|nr:hypothetical protein [Modestobacter sp. DSM 44400]
MLIAWHTQNKVADPRARALSNCLLVAAPGNYYAERDLVPPELRPDLGAARVVITNFHGFALRETQKVSSLGRSVLTGGAASPFSETPDQMVARVCRDFGARRGIVVLNDEAHHCYRRKLDEAEDGTAGLTRAEKAELAGQEAEARIRIRRIGSPLPATRTGRPASALSSRPTTAPPTSRRSSTTSVRPASRTG